ncbi:hypothetical protein KAU11_08115 [Candidatus Babeliales bacterium]|nr:hypothetical protein [Candidatus Babeliales bacterium]
MRVGQVTTLGDYKQLTGKDTLLLNEAVGGTATSVYESLHGGVKMSVLGAGDYVVRETKQVHNYVSGNPHVFEQTTIDLTPAAGVVKQMGYFSSDAVAPYDAGLDGFCLETDDTTVLLKVYKQGVAVFSAAQATWDDPLDGTGASGVTIDPSAFNVLIGEFLYLGGTVFRAGMIVGPKIAWFHTFENSNNRNSTFVGSPTQPLRWSIRSTGGAASMYQVCGKVGSVGTVETTGIVTGHSNGADFVNANVVGTSYALLGIKANTRKITLRPTGIGGMTASNSQFLLELRLNPVVAGIFNYADSGEGYDEVKGAVDGSNTTTGGKVLGCMYVTGKGSDAIALDNLLRPGCTLAGIHDTLVLCVTPLGSNLDVYGSIHITVQP